MHRKRWQSSKRERAHWKQAMDLLLNHCVMFVCLKINFPTKNRPVEGILVGGEGSNFFLRHTPCVLGSKLPIVSL